MTVVIGTSGWPYRDWRGRFYPEELPQRLWLEHYVQHFATVESNNAFYRLPELGTFRAWRDRTPPDFRWAVKASRFLTHVKRLREPEEPVHRLMARAAGLGAKLDAILPLATAYADDEDVLVYSNDDPGCNAVADAVTFAGAVRRAGRTPTRVPAPDGLTPGAPRRGGHRAGRAPAP